MRVENNVIMNPTALTNLGAVAFLWINRIILDEQTGIPVPHSVQDWNSTFMMCGYVAVFVWFVAQTLAMLKYRADSNKSKLNVDNDRLNKLQDEFNESQQKIAVLETELVQLRGLASSHRRLRDKFYLLLGAMAPILKDMEVDFTRGGTMGKLLMSIDDDPPAQA